ncbi:MAG TPA: histidine phosphatase family protein [Acidimicrobiales bacterium]
MSSTRVLVIRHGQSTWNAAGRWQGHADAPLTDLGRAQAAGAVAGLPAVEAIWASDLERARSTADIIAAALELPVRVDDRFRERNAGDWTGLTREEIEVGWPRYLAERRRPAGFEHDEDVLARVIDGLGDVHDTHPGRQVLIVTHGGVLRAMERHCHDVDQPFPNLGGRFFTIGGEDGAITISAGRRLFPLAADQATFTTAP